MKESLGQDDLATIQKYSNAVYRMAYALVKNRYDADDIHQEVFAIWLVKKPDFANEEHERAWFMRVTINLCKNLWKSAWMRKTVGFSEDMEMHAVPEAASEDDRIIEVVKTLPFPYRIVIHLFYYEEFSIKEMADILKMRPSAVRTRLSRARAKLRELLEQEW